LHSTLRAVAIGLSLLVVQPLLSQKANTDFSDATLSWTPTDLPAAFITGNVVCEIDSSIYLHLSTKPELWTLTPLTLLRETGKSTEFDLRSAGTATEKVIATAFNVDVRGNLYVSIQIGSGAQWFVATYGPDGHFIRKIKLPDKLVPYFLLPVSNHRLVVGGVKSRATAEESHTSSLVALLDENGNQLKSLSLPDDDENEQVTKQPAGKYVTYSVANPTIERGRAVLGPGGNIFIFRASPQPKVQVLDGDGNPLRVVHLDLVTEDLLPSNFYVFDDSIAVGYQLTKSDNLCPVKGNFALYNQKTGKLIADYLVPMAPKILLCAQKHSLVYLKASPGDANFQLAHVEIPRTKP
jgi:hypothetical protein